MKFVPNNKILWIMPVLLLLLMMGEVRSASQNCSTAVDLMMESAFSGVGWALEMVDASSKPPTGILLHGFRFPFNWEPVPLGSTQFIGNYDQCLNVKTTKEFGTSYYRADLHINKLGNTVKSPPSRVFADICVPDICTGEDLVPVLEHYIKKIPHVDVSVNGATCLETHKPLTMKSMAALVVLCVVIFIVALATIYDVAYINQCSLFKEESTNASSTSEMNSDEVNGSSIIHSPHATNSHKNGSQTTPADSQHSSMDSSPKPGSMGQVLLSFSLYTNIPNMLSTANKGSIPCVNGIRVLSTTWIVWGHVYFFGEPITENFGNYWDALEKRWSFQITAMFNIGVDCFFTLSGLLLTYKTMKELRTTKPSLQYFKRFYLHRVLRLTPPYLFTMMIYGLLFKLLTTGPFWPQGDEVADECKESFLFNLLYMNNLGNFKDICPSWSWSLSMDMQFFVISPLILLALYYFDRRGLIVPLAMLAGSISHAGYLSYTQKLVAKLVPSEELVPFALYYYLNPLTRVGPYLVGMMTGYLLYKTNCQAQLSKRFVTIGWIMCIATLYGVLFFFHDEDSRPLSNVMTSLFNAFGRTLFGLSISWIIFACTCGYGGIVNKILSSNFFAYFTPISYFTYLIHPAIMRYFFFSQRRFLFANDVNITFIGLGILVVVQLVSCTAYLLFEAPFPKLEKAIRNIWTSKKTKMHEN